MKKIWMAAVLVMILLTYMAVPAGAAEEDNVVFNGDTKKFVMDISGDTKNGFVGMLPGETRTMVLNLYNEASEELKFFMNSDILKTDIAEKGNKKAVYDFQIQRDEEIFFQAVIGGEDPNNISAGKEFLTEDGRILLATLEKGKHAVVSIQMSLDGDSMENEYMNTSGQLKLDFSAETPELAPPAKRVITYIKEKAKVIVKTVKTGDVIPIALITAGIVSFM